MDKVRIKIITLGHLPMNFSKKKIENWNSEIFEICKPIENYALYANSDGPSWEYSDETLRSKFPQNYDGDFLFVIVNVPLEDNWYSRRLEKNRIVFTFHEIKEILNYENIPTENIIYRLLYSFTLIYKSSRNEIPDVQNMLRHAHDETRGCLFDMNGIKTDVINSCVCPIICSECYEKLRNNRVSAELLQKTQKEIKRIKKELFYQIRDFIKVYPVWALVLSSLYAIILGVTGSIIATYIWEKLNTVSQSAIK